MKSDGPGPGQKLAASSLGLAALVLAGCSGGDASPPAAASPTEAQISAYLQSEAERLYPGTALELTDLQFSADRTLICGLVRVRGREAQLFSSADTTPQTLERPIGLPYLSGDAPTTDAIRSRDQQQTREICSRNGLMPSSGAS